MVVTIEAGGAGHCPECDREPIGAETGVIYICLWIVLFFMLATSVAVVGGTW